MKWFYFPRITEKITTLVDKVDSTDSIIRDERNTEEKWIKYTEKWNRDDNRISALEIGNIEKLSVTKNKGTESSEFESSFTWY